MALLHILSGDRAGEEVSLERLKTTFGRGHSVDCILNHPTVSREHFFIERTNGKFIAVDQNSNNGTFVNGERISWKELKRGDRVQAGPFLFEVEIDSDDSSDLEEERPGEIDDGERFWEPVHETFYPREYLIGIRRFNQGRYLESHEVWEEVWLRSPGDEKLFYQMLIQAAVGLHHFEHGNLRGARGMYKAVTEKLARLPGYFMSLDLFAFSRQIEACFKPLNDDKEETQILSLRPLIRLSRDS